MKKSDLIPNCRFCPSREFELTYVKKSRFMAICHALEIIIQPIFTGGEINECKFISRANVETVQFEPVDYCPHIEKLRKEGKIPWAQNSYDFLK
jgi:hypothetical protein